MKMKRFSFNVLCLATARGFPNLVTRALKRQDALFVLTFADSIGTFRARVGQGSFSAGLVDFDALPRRAGERMKTLEEMGQGIGLVAFVSQEKERQAQKALGAGLLRDYVVADEGSLGRLTYALQSASLPGRAGDEDFRNLFETATVGIARTTPEGKILLANPALVQMLGFDSLEDLQSRDLTRNGFVPEHPRSEFQQQIEAEGEVHGFESTWVRKDGSLLHVRESARLVRGPQGRPLYYEGVVEDITEQKRSASLLQAKVAALQTLTAIDRDILSARQAGDILQLVCRSAASLFHTPMAAILSTSEKKWSVKAAFGVRSPEQMAMELSQTHSRNFPAAPSSFLIRNISEKTTMMKKTIALEEVRAILAEPLLVGDVEQGILLVLDHVPRNWTEDDVSLLRTLAGQAAIALEKARLLTDAERRAHELSALHEVVVGLSGERDMKAVLSLIVDSVSQTMQAPSVFIYLYDEKQDVLNLIISKGRGFPAGLTLKRGEGMAWRVAATRKPLLVSNYHTWRHRLRLLDAINYSSALEVPMLFGGMLIGVLGVAMVDDSVRKFTRRDERLLSLFAAQAASAVYNARLFDDIQRSNEELDRLYRASDALLEAVTLDVDEMCRRITRIVVSEFRQSNCSLWLLEGGDSPRLRRCSIDGATSTEIALLPLTPDGRGLIPRAVRTGQIANAPDVFADPDYVAGWPAACSELALPLKNGERVIGALDLQSSEPAAFREDEERVLEQFASRASLMLDHARLVKETSQRLHRLSALHTVDIAVASSLDLQVTLKVFLEQVTTHLRVDAAAILLFNPHLQLLEYAAGRGFRKAGVRRAALRVGEGVGGQAALERRFVGTEDLPVLGQKTQAERLAGEGFLSEYAVPLIARGKLKGTLELYFRKQFAADVEWQNFVETLARRAAVAIDDASLFEELQRSYTELSIAYDSAMEGWARLLELRNLEARGHSHRVSTMTVELSRRMNIPEPDLLQAYRGALLHDIGKLAIPEAVLLKAGTLTEEEWHIVQRHPAIGRDLLEAIDYLRPAAVIPYCHHEKWDGSGYPRGLCGEQIPLVARIFSVVDVWDTLQRDKPHRPAWSEGRTLAFIRERAGRDFDPSVVKVFLAYLGEQNGRGGQNDDVL